MTRRAHEMQRVPEDTVFAIARKLGQCSSLTTIRPAHSPFPDRNTLSNSIGPASALTDGAAMPFSTRLSTRMRTTSHRIREGMPSALDISPTEEVPCDERWSNTRRSLSGNPSQTHAPRREGRAPAARRGVRDPSGRARGRAPMPQGADYSHSIVAGGLLVMSYATRFTPGTSATMRLEIFASTS